MSSAMVNQVKGFYAASTTEKKATPTGADLYAR